VALLVLDANVVIALLDDRDALHARAEDALDQASGHELVLPASAYAEVLVGAFRAVPDRVDEFDATLARVPVRIEPLSAAIARAAARMRASTSSLLLADALVLATASELGGSVLTADRRLSRHARVRYV